MISLKSFDNSLTKSWFEMTKKVSSKKIALIQGGLGPESEISLLSGKAVAKAFDRLNYNYFVVTADSRLFEKLQFGKPDLAFLALHGLYGEDGLPQSICEYLKVPYTGSGVLASSLAMDKIFTKKLMIQHKVPTPDFKVAPIDFNLKQWRPQKKLSYPVVVKASHGGSSLGVFIVKKQKELLPAIKQAQKIGSQVFIESYLENSKELAVSFLQGKILTPIEIQPKKSFYDYKRKYVKGETKYLIPSSLDSFVIEKTKSLAKRIFEIVGVRSYARADFLIQNNQIPWLLEVNTLPGLTEHSLLPKSAKYDGLPFIELIETITNSAQTDYLQ